MSEPWFIRLANWIEDHNGKRIIYRVNEKTGKNEPYLVRYYILKTPFCELMLHQFYQSDRGDLHDHPWRSFGWILQEGYIEHIGHFDGKGNYSSTQHNRVPGDFGTRSAYDLHKVELKPNTAGKVWTLFGTFKRFKSWGFFIPEKGMINFIDYMKMDGTYQPNSEEQQDVFKGWLFPRKV